ncbi:MAG: hypothetical protein ACOYT4_02475 [Nanoarchaeota archaeon]
MEQYSEQQTEIENNEVKRFFLLANAFKEVVKTPGYLEDKTKLKDEYMKILDELENSSREGLNERIRDKVRLRRYESMNWQKFSKSFDKMGVWPKMKSINI